MSTTQTGDREKSQRKDARGISLLGAGGAAALGLVRSVSRRTFGNNPAVENKLNVDKNDNAADSAGDLNWPRTKSAVKTGSGAWVDPGRLLRSHSSVVFSGSSGTDSVVRGQSGSQSTTPSPEKTSLVEVDTNLATTDSAKKASVGTATPRRANTISEHIFSKGKCTRQGKGEEGIGDMGRRLSRANISGIFAKLGGGQLFRSTRNVEDAGNESFKKERSTKPGESSKNSDRRRRHAEAMNRRRKLKPGWLVGLSESGNRTKREESARTRSGAAASMRSPKTPGEIDFVDDEFFDSEEDDDLHGAAAPRSLLNDDFIAYQTRKKGANNNRGRVRNWGRQ